MDRASRYYSLPSEVEELRPLLIRHPPVVDAIQAAPGLMDRAPEILAHVAGAGRDTAAARRARSWPVIVDSTVPPDRLFLVSRTADQDELLDVVAIVDLDGGGLGGA